MGEGAESPLNIFPMRLPPCVFWLATGLIDALQSYLVWFREVDVYYYESACCFFMYVFVVEA